MTSTIVDVFGCVYIRRNAHPDVSTTEFLDSRFRVYDVTTMSDAEKRRPRAALLFVSDRGGNAAVGQAALRQALF